MAFAPNSHTLATASGDRTVFLWDLADRTRPRQLTRLPGHTSETAVTTVAFASDGRTLATGSDGGVFLWDLAELNALRNHPIQHACRFTGRGLNRDEWARYVSDLPYQDTCRA